MTNWLDVFRNGVNEEHKNSSSSAKFIWAVCAEKNRTCLKIKSLDPVRGNRLARNTRTHIHFEQTDLIEGFHSAVTKYRIYKVFLLNGKPAFL